MKLGLSKRSGNILLYFLMAWIICSMFNWIIKIFKNQKLSIILERFFIIFLIFLAIEIEAFLFSKISIDLIETTMK
jgi:small neutral amino acid transporter SnatA (MarC family)